MTRALHLLIFLSAFILLSIESAFCTDIKVTSPALGSLSSGSTTVSFNITWKSSWRVGAPWNNWDAAWVFVKFRKNGGDWAHASLNDSGHSMPAGATSTTGYVDSSASFNISTNPVAGVFIYRDANGSGVFTANNVSLSWNYAQDGVSNTDTVDIRVFAIEMAYVPAGTFFAGDNATSTGAFKQGSSDSDPWFISGEAAITTGNQAGSGTNAGEGNSEYYYVTDSSGDDDASGSAFTIGADYPKGYQSFYLMKGEISQGQWVAFFNTLTATQKSTRDTTAASGKNSDSLTYRNNVSWTGSGDATLPDQGSGATYEAVAMNYLSWADIAAYLDWAGLRPISELEYERAARGPYRAASGEYAWGTSASLTQALGVVNGGTSTEAPTLAANCVYGNSGTLQGPMRVGAMSYQDTTRIDSGGGYYGNMDLSGNLWERCVTVGNSTGRGFNGTKHGNGALDATGNGDATSWPGTDGIGAGFRGGSWASASTRVRLSDRDSAGKIDTTRDKEFGGRGGRTQPAAGMGAPVATPTNTPTSTPSPTPTLTSTPTYTPTSTVTPTPTPVATSTPTYTPTSTVTPTPTPTATRTPTYTPTSTNTPTPTPTSGASTYLVFTTTTTYSGDLGGLSGADAKCQAAAPVAGTWKALIASSTVSISSRITVSAAVYNYYDNSQVATGSADLFDGTFGTIKTTTGGTASYWTGANANGSSTGSDGDTCSDWQSSSSERDGRISSSSATTGFHSGSFLQCDAVYRLACINRQ